MVFLTRIFTRYSFATLNNNDNNTIIIIIIIIKDAKEYKGIEKEMKKLPLRMHSLYASFINKTN